MTTQSPDRDPSQGPEESQAASELVTQSPPPDADSDAEAILARQIHRWKGEGGSLHPDD